MNISAAFKKTFQKTSSYEDRLFLGEALLRENLITVTQLQEVLDIQRLNKKKLGEIIIDQGYASEDAILKTIEKYFGVKINSIAENLSERIKKRQISWKDRFKQLRIPISVKFAIAITFIIWLTILILSFITLNRQKEMLYHQTLKAGKISLKYFTNNARIPLLGDDVLRLNTLIKEAASVEGILYAVIVDRRSIIKAHTDHSQIGATLPEMKNVDQVKTEDKISHYTYQTGSGENVLNLSQPVTFQNVELGGIHVGLSLDFIKDQTRKATRSLIAMSFLIIILGIFIAIFFGISFSRPIYQLVIAAQEIARGNYQYRLDFMRKDELGDLASAFNYMSGELWKKFLISKSFGRYVSPEVLDIILANPESSWLKGIHMEATILFTDVRHFTSFSEKREPEEVVECLNEYFHIVTRHILNYGGYVDKFIGDAVMGVFCIPIHHADHAERAVKAAIDMQNELQTAMSEKNPILNRIGVGINSGILVAGNLGSDTKIEYTVIGDSVNVASRLTGLAGAGEIIISKDTYQLVKHIVSAKELPSQKVKGKSQPIEVFQVLGLNRDGSHTSEQGHEK
jgi:adenylate cyclase